MRKEYKVIIDDKDTIRWYFKNQLHNDNGPAVIYANGNGYWYLNGEQFSEHEFNNRKNIVLGIENKCCTHQTPDFDWTNYDEDSDTIVAKTIEEYKVLIDSEGTTRHYLNGELHNQNGAAIIWANGDKDYYVDGLRLSKREFDDRNKENSILYKVGDRIKVTNNNKQDYFKVGTIIEVISIENQETDSNTLTPNLKGLLKKLSDNNERPYQKGDKLRIIGDTSDHNFMVNEIVVVTKVYSTTLLCSGFDGFIHCISKEDIKCYV